jgi:hypothetical protein
MIDEIKVLTLIRILIKTYLLLSLTWHQTNCEALEKMI